MPCRPAGVTALGWRRDEMRQGDEGVRDRDRRVVSNDFHSQLLGGLSSESADVA